MLLALLLLWWFRPRRVSFRNVRPVLHLGSHQWVSLESDSFCAGCFQRIGGWLQLNGVQCQVCHMAAHVLCSRSKVSACKPVASNTYKDTNPHHWVRAELQLNAICCQCRTLCGSAYVGADAVLCSWCQRTAHITCSSRFDAECDFGRLKKVIIPPSFVRLENTEILELPLRVAPIVVVVNSKSGGQLGLLTLTALYGLLNPVQVLDLVGEGITRLNWYRNTKRLMLLVAGGDGTVSSVISALYDDAKPWTEPPPVAILPLGTGNDLSITLNWGKSASGCESLPKMTAMLQEVMQEVSNARKSLLDRWTVTIGGKTTYTMCNYVGIGLDAKVAWDFQRLRDRKPYLFSSRVSDYLDRKQVYIRTFRLFRPLLQDLQRPSSPLHTQSRRQNHRFALFGKPNYPQHSQLRRGRSYLGHRGLPRQSVLRRQFNLRPHLPLSPPQSYGPHDRSGRAIQHCPSRRVPNRPKGVHTRSAGTRLNLKCQRNRSFTPSNRR